MLTMKNSPIYLTLLIIIVCFVSSCKVTDSSTSVQKPDSTNRNLTTIDSALVNISIVGLKFSLLHHRYTANQGGTSGDTSFTELLFEFTHNYNFKNVKCRDCDSIPKIGFTSICSRIDTFKQGQSITNINILTYQLDTTLHQFSNLTLKCFNEGTAYGNYDYDTLFVHIPLGNYTEDRKIKTMFLLGNDLNIIDTIYYSTASDHGGLGSRSIATRKRIGVKFDSSSKIMISH